MHLTEKTSHLIRRIYEAPSSDGGWKLVTRDLIDTLGIGLLVTSIVDLRERRFSALEPYGNGSSRVADGLKEYVEEQSAHDKTIDFALVRPDGRMLSTLDVFGATDYFKSPFTRWARDRFGSGYWTTCYSAPDDGLTVALAAHPRKSSGPLASAPSQLFNLLFEHVDQSLRLALRPPSLEAETGAALLLDRDGRVREVNARAEAVLGGDSGLTIVKGRLTCHGKCEQARLDQLIASTVDPTVLGGIGGAIRIKLSDEFGLVAISVRPLPQGSIPFDRYRRAAIVRLSSPQLPIGLKSDVAKLFGLTARERQCAEMLANGRTSEEISTQLGISRHTVRVYLQSLLNKTDTRRQAELVRLLWQHNL